MKKYGVKIGFILILATIFLASPLSANAEAIKIIVETTLDKCLYLEVNDDVSIEDIKSEIETREGIPVSAQLLTFNDNELEDDLTLAQYSIENGSPIYLTSIGDTVAIYGTEIDIVTQGNGLYAESENGGVRYVYKGSEVDNYITFNNETWRIIAIESDGTLKIMRNDSLDGTRPFDTSDNRTTGYCSYAVYSDGSRLGCNAWAATANTISDGLPASIFKNGDYSGEVDKDSSLNEYLNGEYYRDSLSSAAKSLIVEYLYNIGGAYASPSIDDYDYTITDQLADEDDYQWKGKVALINLSDYIRSNSSDDNYCDRAYGNYFSASTCKSTTWMATFSNDTWTITPRGSSAYYVWIINTGVLRSTNASNSADYFNTAYLVVRPVVHLTSDLLLSGSGSSSDPYEITYIKVEETVNGTVDYTVNGNTVSITTAPDTYYEVASITVTDSSDNNINPTNNQFTLPDDRVAFIKVTFQLDKDELENKLEEIKETIDTATSVTDINSAKEELTDDLVDKVNESGDNDLKELLEEINSVLNDTTSPIILPEGLDGSYTNEDVKISISDETDISYNITLNGSDVTSNISLKTEDEAYTLTVTEEGKYTLVVTDEAFNKTTVSFTIDKTAPVVIINNNKEITQIDDVLYYNGDVSVELVDDNLESLSVTLNDSELKEIDLTGKNTFTKEGKYVLTATDKANNVTTITMVIDKTAPVVSIKNEEITQIDDVLYYNGDVSVELIDDNLESLSVTLNDSELKEIDLTKEYTFTEDGEYVLTATDKADNDTTITFIIDKTEPVITLYTDDDELFESGNSTDKEVKAYIDEANSYFIVFTRNGEAIDFVEGKTYGNGSYELMVVDLAGNNTTVTFVVDNSETAYNVNTVNTAENPETYDDILPYFVLSAISIIGLISIGIYFRKNMKNKIAN